jgi:sRNA-binding carbon storage regulator CsrA
VEIAKGKNWEILRNEIYSKIEEQTNAETDGRHKDQRNSYSEREI